MDAVEAENLRFISTTHRTAFNERRRYEWQTFGMTLTLYVLTVSAVYAGNFRLPQHAYTSCAVVIVAILVWILSCLFLREIHKANEKNKDIADAAERDIVNSLTGSIVKDVLPLAGVRGSNWWALRWQCVIIGLVAIVSAVLIVAAPDLESSKTPIPSAAVAKQ